MVLVPEFELDPFANSIGHIIVESAWPINEHIDLSVPLFNPRHDAQTIVSLSQQMKSQGDLVLLKLSEQSNPLFPWKSHKNGCETMPKERTSNARRCRSFDVRYPARLPIRADLRRIPSIIRASSKICAIPMPSAKHPGGHRVRNSILLNGG
jgi:hypothetical protein